LQGLVDRENGTIELSWYSYQQENVSKIAIYKGKKEGAVNLLQEVSPQTRAIVDRKVQPNNEYVYMLRGLFVDGSVGATVMLNVKY
jgi:hypothetical protein